MLWIHAGPHKAASSYVTERLRKNRSTLAAQRVLMDGDNNLLANSIAEKNYQPLEQALSGLPSDFQRILISSSSLDTRILKRSIRLFSVTWHRHMDLSLVLVILLETSNPG